MLVLGEPILGFVVDPKVRGHQRVAIRPQQRTQVDARDYPLLVLAAPVAPYQLHLRAYGLSSVVSSCTSSPNPTFTSASASFHNASVSGGFLVSRRVKASWAGGFWRL